MEKESLTSTAKDVYHQPTAQKFKEVETISGAEAIVRCLIEEGVDVLFGYPGGAIMPVYDELYKYQDQLNHILVRHEQGAGHAAQGYARITRRPGVSIVTSGPGATNLVTPLGDALMDSTPIVCISGQVPAHLLGTDAFQETDVIGVTTAVTKWNYQITKASEIPEVFAKAFYIANSGRPGPVMIDITKNAQFEELEWKGYQPNPVVRSYKPKPAVKMNRIEEAAELLNSAERPFMLVGHGVLISKAQEEVMSLMEKAGIPAACTLQGLSAVPKEHPMYMGMLGMHGNYGPNLLSSECDVLLAVGMRFDDRVTGVASTYATQAKVIHIEIDPSEIDKIIPTTVAVNADAKEALQALLPLIKTNTHDDWVARFKACEIEEYEKVIGPDLFANTEGMKMPEVIKCLSDLTKGEAIIVPDVGQHQMAAGRYYEYTSTDGWVTSGGLGTMGFAMPAALGCAFAAPDRDVVAIIGDGCFQMCIQELGTISQTKLPVKMIILNNSFLGMVRQWQELFFDRRYSFTELQNPDFITIAKGYGIDGKTVKERANLEQALQDMLDHEGPYVLELIVEKEHNVFPMVPAGCGASEMRLE